MKIIEELKALIKKPFPMGESWASFFKVTILISLFIVFFLFVYRPFDLSSAESNLLVICVGFGFMAFFGTLIFELFIRYILKVKVDSPNFTFGKWLLYMCGVMLSISLFNFLFVRLYFFGDVLWEYFPYIIRGTFMVGLLPVVFLGAISLLRNEKKYKAIAKELSDKPNENNLSTSNHIETETEIFDVPIRQLLYIEAMQNYVKIGYLNDEKRCIEKVERATLKAVLNEIEYDSIVRCHRSFLVNKSCIISMSGNAQGLQLRLTHCDKSIPVSRSYVEIFR